MNKNHTVVRKLIESAIEGCVGPGYREVLEHLEAAARAVKRKEASESVVTPRDKWSLEASASPMKNLTRPQLNDVINKIEGLIQDERKKTDSPTPDGLITG